MTVSNKSWNYRAGKEDEEVKKEEIGRKEAQNSNKSCGFDRRILFVEISRKEAPNSKFGTNCVVLTPDIPLDIGLKTFLSQS